MSEKQRKQVRKNSSDVRHYETASGSSWVDALCDFSRLEVASFHQIYEFALEDVCGPAEKLGRPVAAESVNSAKRPSGFLVAKLADGRLLLPWADGFRLIDPNLIVLEPGTRAPQTPRKPLLASQAGGKQAPGNGSGG